MRWSRLSKKDCQCIYYIATTQFPRECSKIANGNESVAETLYNDLSNQVEFIGLQLFALIDSRNAQRWNQAVEAVAEIVGGKALINALSQ